MVLAQSQTDFIPGSRLRVERRCSRTIFFVNVPESFGRRDRGQSSAAHPDLQFDFFFSNGAALIKEKMKANGREDEEGGRFVISAPRELAGFMNSRVVIGADSRIPYQQTKNSPSLTGGPSWRSDPATSAGGSQTACSPQVIPAPSDDEAQLGAQPRSVTLQTGHFWQEDERECDRIGSLIPPFHSNLHLL